MADNEFDSISESEMGIYQILERFNLSLGMINVCSKSCGLLNRNHGFSTELTSNHRLCLQTCASNFTQTYDTFYNKVKQKKLFGNHEQNEDNEDDQDNEDNE